MNRGKKMASAQNCKVSPNNGQMGNTECKKAALKELGGRKNKFSHWELYDCLAGIVRMEEKLCPEKVEMIEKQTGIKPVFYLMVRSFASDEMLLGLANQFCRYPESILSFSLFMEHLPFMINKQKAQQIQNSVSEMATRLEDWRMDGFLLKGALKLLELYRNMDPEKLEHAMETFVLGIESGEKFISKDALWGMKVDDTQLFCASTSGYFLKGLENGTLVKMKSDFRGEARNFFIKGFWDCTGNALAYEPKANMIFEVRIIGERIEFYPQAKWANSDAGIGKSFREKFLPYA